MDFTPSKNIYTISEITGKVKNLIEDNFQAVSLIGEISNFKAHFSGHWYFTLKDENAQINCTMWKGVNNYVFFTPQDGMKVIVTGRLTVYPPRGTYQVDVRSMKPAGEGELQAAFERLKAKLAEEGLFDADLKKNIPVIPEKIGVITAIDSAAFRDMVSVATRRFPAVEVVVASSRVQGEGAAEEIARNIERMNKQSNVDVIIIARGGGSIEDLWAFNEEIVARAIFKSRIPVITGVGHEIDFTISDFVADLRAPTPTAAMELATPDKNELFAFIRDFSYNSPNKLLDKITSFRQEISFALKSYGFRNPRSLVKNRIQELDNLLYRIRTNANNQIVSYNNRLGMLNSTIKANNVSRILNRGFAIVKQDDKIIKKAKKLKTDKEFKIQFSDNEVNVNNAKES